MDKGLRGHCINTPSHLSLVPARYFCSRSLEVYVSYELVMFRRKVLSEVICKVFSSHLQVEAKLFLLDAPPHPVEPHVKYFGAFPAHVFGKDAMGGFTVSFD